MFCTNCGKQIDDNLSFCIYCGKPTKKTAAAAQASPANAAQTNNAGGTNQSVEPAAAMSQPSSSAPGKPQTTVTPTQSRPVQQPAPVANTAPVAQPAAVATASVVAATGNAKPKSRLGLIIGIVIALVIIGGIVVAGIMTNWFGLAQAPVKSSVDEYTWEELSNISSQISKTGNEHDAIEIAKKYNLTTEDGKLDGTQTKQVVLSNGVQTKVQIVGFAHDNKASGGKAGISFIFTDCIDVTFMNATDTNSGGWEKSRMRSYLNSEVLTLLPDDLKQEVVQVDKLTNNVGKTNTASSVSSTADSLWLLSATEICGSISWYTAPNADLNAVFNAEGSEYKLFRDTGVNPDASNNLLIKKHQKSSDGWWGRSPDPNATDGFQCVGPKGNPHSGTRADYSRGVVPGFCI